MARKKGSSNISPTIEKFIIGEALKERNKPRSVLASQLQGKIEEMGELSPTIDNLERKISWARNHEPDPEDSPWYVETLTDYDIPPEALPAVLKVWLSREIRNTREKTYMPLTIREAKWVARLLHVFKDIRSLELYALRYAYDERVSIILSRSERGKRALKSNAAKVIRAQWGASLYEAMTGHTVDFELKEKEEGEEYSGYIFKRKGTEYVFKIKGEQTTQRALRKLKDLDPDLVYMLKEAQHERVNKAKG